MPFNSADTVLHRRATVARLYLQGWRQYAIAAEVKVTEGQISQDLDAIRTEWLQSAVINFNEKKAEELARIDNLEATAYKAWFDSMQPLRKSSKKMRGDVPSALLADISQPKQKPRTMEQYEYTEERLGDPRYLLVVANCIEKRIKILGLEAPIKIAQTNKDGQDVDTARTWHIVDHTGGHRIPEPDEEY